MHGDFMPFLAGKCACAAPFAEGVAAFLALASYTSTPLARCSCHRCLCAYFFRVAWGPLPWHAFNTERAAIQLGSYGPPRAAGAPSEGLGACRGVQTVLPPAGKGLCWPVG